MRTIPAIKLKAVAPVQWARQIVAEHRKNTPYLNLRMAIWMNPTNDSLDALLNGIELVEICEKAAFDDEPEYRSIRFGPSWGKPGLILTLTSPATLNLDLEMNGKKSFFNKLKSKLDSNKAITIFPNSKRNSVEILEELLGPVEIGC